MLQIDENIGGRQDRKNNGLRTKTLAVGLLMMAGCFVVGYFGATTTTTTTAHPRGVSSPNGNFSTQKNHSQNSIQISIHNLTLHKFLHLLFLKHNMSLTRSGKVNGMVSNLQQYTYGTVITITNNTPYATHVVPHVEYGGFGQCVYPDGPIASGGTWTASMGGTCLVTRIFVILNDPDPKGKPTVKPTVKPTNPPVPSGCKAKKNNSGVTDAGCARCENGDKYWPCNLNPPMCEGTGCPWTSPNSTSEPTVVPTPIFTWSPSFTWECKPYDRPSVIGESYTQFSITMDDEERMEHGFPGDHWDDACSVVSIVA